MTIIFKEHTSRMGGKHLMSDKPFAVIRGSREIYLSGDYTIEELRAILETAQQSVQSTGAVDLGWECGICKSSNMECDLLCGFCDAPRPSCKGSGKIMEYKEQTW